MNSHSDSQNLVDIYLSTGQTMIGNLIGAPLVSSGELVFTTGMVGYSEALTDPSYFGQILNFTYPMIGNYGLPDLALENETLPRGMESSKVSVAGVFISDYFEKPEHRLSKLNLNLWLKKHNKPGVYGLDTRWLTQLVRDHGTIFAKIIPRHFSGFVDHSKFHFQESLSTEENFFNPSNYNLMNEVSNSVVTEYGEGPVLINLINFGVKWNIVREFIQAGCRVRLLPWNSNYNDFLDAHAWVLSNGPGNPALLTDVIEKIKDLISKEAHLFGICLGHQLLALACGAQTEKLSYGHRSHNQPVQMTGTTLGYMTSQNHGYVVKKENLPRELEIWFENLNDGSIEGLRHQSKLIRSVQFHPEACGGPEDTGFLIKDFILDVTQKVNFNAHP